MKIKNAGLLLVGLILFFGVLAPPSEGERSESLTSPEVEALTGDEILQKEDENEADSSIMTSEMTIVHKSGARRVRKIRMWVKGDDYTLVRFLSPANVKGTGFLSVKDDDWLYLPALRKVRRIAAREKGKSFMGSDFSYEDVGGDPLQEKYKAKLVTGESISVAFPKGTDEVTEQHDCYVLELIPKKPEDAIYSRLIRWVDKGIFVPVKTEYYDEHGDLLKIMYSSGFKKVKGFWISGRMEMRNAQKGSRTIIVVEKFQPNPKIPDEMFTTRQLQKK